MSVNLFEKTKRRIEKFGPTNQQTHRHVFPWLGSWIFCVREKDTFSPYIHTVRK